MQVSECHSGTGRYGRVLLYRKYLLRRFLSKTDNLRFASQTRTLCSISWKGANLELCIGAVTVEKKQFRVRS